MKVICYGDSNTYGYDGTDPYGGRLTEDARWPELLGRSLGRECLNCGLNGRRVPRFPRSIDADLRLLSRAREGDLIIIMLGTNDLLCGAGPEETADHMRHFLEKLREARPNCALLLTAPPPAVIEGEDLSPDFSELAEAYKAAAQELGVCFADTTQWQIPTAGDGVHFSERGHRLFALKMGQTIHMLMG